MSQIRDIKKGEKVYQFATIGFPSEGMCVILDCKKKGYFLGTAIFSSTLSKGFFSEEAIIFAIDNGYDLVTKEGITKAIAEKEIIKKEYFRTHTLDSGTVDNTTYTDYIISGKYISGHPDISMTNVTTAIGFNRNLLGIFITVFKIPGTNLGSIDLKEITDVTVEDATTLEKRITATRLLAIGIFAFAAKKKKVHELYYVTIKWKNGKFEQEAIFEFEGKNSVQNAYNLKNKIMEHANRY
jgi:hypothetical protein